MDRKAFFENHTLFRKLGRDKLDHLCGLSQEKFFEGRKFIIEEGELSGGIFFIRTGRVGVVKGRGSARPEVLAYLSDGEWFGEMSFLDGQPAIAAIQAAEATICEFMPEEGLKNFLADNSNFAFQFILTVARSLSQRLRETDERLVRFMGLIREEEG